MTDRIEGGFPTLTSPGGTPKITSIFDCSAEFLGQLRLWIEQNPPSISVKNILGFNQQQDIRGRIDSTGAVTNGTGFTASRLGAGDYQITYTTKMSAAPSVAATVDSNSGASLCIVVANATASSFQTNIFDTTTGVKTDAGFYFSAAPFT